MWSGAEQKFMVIRFSPLWTIYVHHVRWFYSLYSWVTSSSDLPLDIGYETFIFMVMEVIWGRIFGLSEAYWSSIDLKYWHVNYLSHYLLFDISLDIGYETFSFVVKEVIWGHIFGHREVKWPQRTWIKLGNSLFYFTI